MVFGNFDIIITLIELTNTYNIEKAIRNQPTYPLAIKTKGEEESHITSPWISSLFSLSKRNIHPSHPIYNTYNEESLIIVL